MDRKQLLNEIFTIEQKIEDGTVTEEELETKRNLEYELEKTQQPPA